MSIQTQRVTLDLTEVQREGLQVALMCRMDHCQDMIECLVRSKNDKTALAHFWRTELATAEQLLAIVRKGTA
jgi:hypothetical protein